MAKPTVGDGQGAGAGGAKGYFTEGRGRGFDIPERAAPKEHGRGVADGEKIIIDLADLNRPGKGPINYDPARGRDFNVPTQSGDKDGDSDIA